MLKKAFICLLTISLFTLLTLKNALSCACGCGVFNVGTSALIPNCEGGVAFLQYDQMNQAQNWRKENKSDGHNHDKNIRTDTVTAGAQYMFNRSFGAAVRLPYVTRYTESVPHSGKIMSSRHSDIGDVRINGIYSGIFDDMSTGLILGLKLPTGSTKTKDLNRNQQIGTGSTDSILGAYHVGKIDEEGRVGYFVQGNWERPFIRSKGYTPGYEISAATGIYYNQNQIFSAGRLTPILQFMGSKKGQDSGFADPSHNSSTGYNMIFFAPALEVGIKQFKIYADIEFPIYRNVNGNQLVPNNMYKVILGYNF